MKIFGHPLHIMLIHFPSALFPMDFVCSLLAFYLGSDLFTNASFCAMAGGVLAGFFAIITGAADLIHVSEQKSAVVKKVLIHGSINTLVVMGYSVLAFISIKNYPALVSDTVPEIIIKGFLVTFMIAGNYIGGNLILKDRIGLEKD
ncbi:DUF2231 domain-containing protein [Rubrolithibacter danxiaensis]|uniref:DUF2231 domain-containing protein n=1 Tax=Rubrolithibacter danxiaensis TaxID=3390805 RepID=UPI003BF7A1C2